MRAIIALVLIALLMGLAGWLTIGHSPEKSTINIETEEIQRDTENAVENAQQLLEGATGTSDSPSTVQGRDTD